MTICLTWVKTSLLSRTYYKTNGTSPCVHIVHIALQGVERNLLTYQLILYDGCLFQNNINTNSETKILNVERKRERDTDI